MLVAVGCGALATSCGADHAALAGDGSGGHGNEGGSGSDLPLPPISATGSCTTGVVQECSVYYKSGDIQNCFVGVQLCIDGEWGTCTDQDTVDEMIAELGYDEMPVGEGGAPGAGGAGGAGG